MKIKIHQEMQVFIKLEVRSSTPSWPPLQADRWDGGFNRSRAFRRAWDLGWLSWGPLGRVLEEAWGFQESPRAALEATWRRLGGLGAS